ncbi:DEBR0S2_13982g1_1 [Brettanomyces bruxellensis]|uniref:DEBR0S2_13982g1_1 n=1 Tax=Dekkera bruxellensis TaxID=5007 RepID=A0A7D9CYC7_DEKBR|nr:DEBR0S2_13982g1_1 [Brettanomyces bruxellensis]
MIEAIALESSLKISELAESSSLGITASALSSDNVLYISLSDGRLLLYQLPKASSQFSKSRSHSNSEQSSANQDLDKEAQVPTNVHEDKRTKGFDPTSIGEEEATLLHSYKLEGPALQICLLEPLNYTFILSKGVVYLYSYDTGHGISLVHQYSDYKHSLVETWSDIPKQIDDVIGKPRTAFEDLDVDDKVPEEDDEYDNEDNDSISLATVKYSQGPSFAQDRRFSKKLTYSSYTALAAKRRVVILSWHYKGFKGRSEFVFHDKVVHMNFLNGNILLIGFESGDFVKLNLRNGASTPLQLQFVDELGSPPQISRSSSFFFRTATDYLNESFKTTNDKQLVILKNNLLIKLNADFEPIVLRQNPRSESFKNPMIVEQTSHFSSGGSSFRKLVTLKYWFPYIITVYGNSVEVHSLEDYDLIERINISGPKALGAALGIQFNSLNMLLISTKGVYKFYKTDYNCQLRQFERKKDYSNAINLLEKLNPLLLDEDEQDNDNISSIENSLPARQYKFMKLRKLQLLRARDLMDEGKYDKAINLFIEYIASPNFVLQHLPKQIKQKLGIFNEQKVQKNHKMHNKKKKDPKSKKDEDYLINQLILYLTDTRRKLTRLLDPDQPKFQWRGYTISLDLYEHLRTDEQYSTPDNLKIIDDSLFKCYLNSNPKMIGPFLRIPNFCDFKLVESECLENHMFSELIDFYYIRSRHEKALKLLDHLCFHREDTVNIDEGSSYLSLLFNAEYMVRYLQKLGNSELDLILKYSQELIELDPGYFKIIFMNDTDASESLDKSQILAYVHKHQWAEIEQNYLEYIIFDTNEKTPEFVNSLINLYMNKQDISEVFKKLKEILQTGSYDEEACLKEIESLINGDLDENSKTLLYKLKAEPLFSLGRHEEALSVFLVNLRDNEGAIEYCLRVRKEETELGTDLLFKLLDRYLVEHDADNTIRLLNDKRLKFLDLTHILERLPGNITVGTVMKFVETKLRLLSQQSVHSGLESELTRIKLIDSKSQLLSLKKPHFRMTSSSLCGICHKGFEPSSILCILSGGEIAHYSCSHNQH